MLNMISLVVQSLTLGYVSMYTVVLVRLFYRSELTAHMHLSTRLQYQVAVLKARISFLRLLCVFSSYVVLRRYIGS
jgi:hypothetical protein